MVNVRPLSEYIGAEISGVDITQPLAPADKEAILAAWYKHLVLVFRGRPLTDEQHITFTGNFGTLENSALSEVGRYQNVSPKISVVSNIVIDGKPIGSLGAGEAFWHTDSSCDDPPPDGSLLRALEVPPSGGDTSFASMYAAYDALPADLAAAIEGLRANHDATYTAAGALRKGRQEVTDVREAAGARHPLARTHPVTGRKALYLGRRRNGYVEGLSVADSEVLLDRLWAHATQEQFTFTHQWRPDDLLIWDNRCVMHRRDSFDGSFRRLMHRTQLVGTRPY